MKIIITIIIATVALTILQFDDDLSPKAREWISQIDKIQINKSEAYFYLNGMLASEQDDVIEVGKKRFHAYINAEEKVRLAGEIIPYQDYPPAKRIDKPIKDNLIYCKLWGNNCLTNILKYEYTLTSEVEKRRTLLKRYNQFLDYTEFKTLTKPSLTEEYPEYTLLGYGNRLRLFEAINISKKSGPSLAIKMLLNDIVKLRVHLSIADNLLHKMFFGTMVSNNLTIIAYISLSSHFYENLNIPLLNKKELDFELPMIREFNMIHNTLKGLDKHPGFFNTGGISNIPSWIIRSAFKPNMTINDYVPIFINIINLSKMSPEQYASSNIMIPKLKFNLLNIGGRNLINTTTPDYNVYLSTLYDLNCKIALVNYVTSGKRTILVNPYYPNKEVVTSNDKAICLDGPYVDKRDLRCIFTKM